jgi:RNA polymerase sigma-70 factor, ECF subfamily
MNAKGNPQGRTAEPDAAIIEKLQAGDAATFARLVEQHQNTVLNACFRFLYNREDAEDVTQEVFIEVVRSIASFRGEAQLSTWIYRIAVTKSLDAVRRKTRKKRIAEIRSLFGHEPNVEEARAAETSDPARKLEQEERLQIIQAAIRRLPEKQGVAFTLSKCEGFGIREIAEVMELTVPAVDALLQRAKAHLQKRLTDYFTGELRKK